MMDIYTQSYNRNNNNRYNEESGKVIMWYNQCCKINKAKTEMLTQKIHN